MARCYSLDNGGWWLQQSLLTERYFAAASLSPAGVLISGGALGTGSALSTTEILANEGWKAGPSMPMAVYDHCHCVRS